MLYRYARHTACDVSASADLSAYTDGAAVSGYAREAMAWANAAGLITGETESALNPSGASTRAVLAAVLTRFCETIIK